MECDRNTKYIYRVLNYFYGSYLKSKVHIQNYWVLLCNLPEIRRTSIELWGAPMEFDRNTTSPSKFPLNTPLHLPLKIIITIPIKIPIQIPLCQSRIPIRNFNQGLQSRITIQNSNPKFQSKIPIQNFNPRFQSKNPIQNSNP